MSETEGRTNSGSAGEGHLIDWDSYASQYDFLATHNPGYRENIEFLRARLPDFRLPKAPVVCDLGAGTGNFLCAIARDIKGATYYHVDANPEMNRIAAEKYERAGLSQINLVEASAHEAEFSDASLDLVICINALYAMPPQERVLKRIFQWLKPGGVFFVIDFGRQTRMLDWSKYIIGSVVSEKGLMAGVKVLSKSVGNFVQNYKGSKGQGDGTYWLHSTEEFKVILCRNGFSVEEITMCYRDYCDMAVCRKPTAPDQGPLLSAANPGS